MGIVRQIKRATIKVIVSVLVIAECSTFLVLLIPKPAHAASLTVASATSETQQTTTSSTYTASDTSIASGSLPAGTYFVAWGAAVANSNTNEISNARLVRGSTEIAAMSHEAMAGTAANMGIARSGYWLGSLSGSEALTIQFSTSLATTTTAYIDSKFIKAIRLDTNLTADNHYFTSGSQESSSDEAANAATGSWTDVKTLTKTFSSYDTEDYLVFASMEISPDSTTNDCSGRIEIDGTASMVSTIEGEDTADQQAYALAKISSIGTGSKSIKLQGQSVGTATCDFRRSRIYVFRASAFDQAVENYSSGESTLASSTWTDKNSQTYTPNQSETVMVIGSRIQGASATGCPIATRFNDGATNYVDTHAYVANNATADYAIGMSAASMTISAATTFKTQFQRVSSTCTVKVKESTLIVWSMTLRDPATYSQSAYRWFDDSTSGGGGGWWSNNWLNRRKVTFNNSQSTENLINFPVRVSLTSSNIDYSKTQNAGQDIRFTDSDGTVLKHEIEKWDESGTSEVWVKVPRIDSGSTTDYIWMYYNNTLVTDGQDPSNVWDSNNQAVWHMKETSGTTIDDATSNNRNGTKQTATEPNPITGKVNGAQDFDGSNDNVNAGDTLDFSPSQSMTISGWVNVDNTPAALGMVASKYDAGVAGEWSFGVDSSMLVSFLRECGSFGTISNTALSLDTWYQLAVVYNGTTLSIYINGALDKQVTDSCSISNTATDVVLGAADNGSGVESGFDGLLDEMRVANTNRSGEWIEADYKSQNNQMNSFGNEESSTYSLDTPGIWLNRRKITFNNSQSSENLTNFPVRVSLSSSTIDYGKTQIAGQDLRFIDADGSTILKHEIEKWDENGTSEAWVKVPQIDSGSTTDYIWMYYNNTTVTDGQDAANVWDSNTKGAWHLKETPTVSSDCAGGAGTKEICDSTSTNNDADATGSWAAGDQIAGKINGSLEFDRVDEYVDTTTAANDFDSTQGTMSIWMYRTFSDATAGYFTTMAFGGDSANNTEIYWDDTTNTFLATYIGQNTVRSVTIPAASIPQNTWTLTTVTWDRNADQLKAYVNGSQVGGTTTGLTLWAGAADEGYIGSTVFGPGSDTWQGQLDEVRLSNIARSGEWIEADYKTQNNQMNSFASEEANADFTPLAATNTAHTLTSDGEAFRLRMLLHVANNDLPTGSVSFKLQFAQKSGSCDTGYSGETYGDVGTGSGDIRYEALSGASDGAAMSADSDDPTHSSDTVVAQTHEQANNFTSTSRINRNQDGKWEFALVDFSAPGGTSYCFRVVKSDGNAIATPSVVPEITTVASNTLPNNPGSLAQKKTDDTVLTTGAWANDTSIKFTATVTDPDTSDTLQLCVEKDVLGTDFSGTEDSCGTGVAYSGSGVTATVTISSLTDASEYHWQARVKDAGGLYSSWVSYDTNLESARDFGTDTTAPTGGTVYDGTTTGVDKTFSDTSLSSLSANWDGFNFAVSGILKYEYSIGTTAGGTDTKNWTDNSTTTSVTATGLTLQTSKVYYVNVRATDNAGNTVVRSSNGQLVAPNVSFSVSPASITFADLKASNSYTDTKTTTLTTSTNAYGGYVVRAFATDFLRSSGNFTLGAFTGGTYALPDSWQSGDTGLGYTSSDTDIQGSNKFQNNPCPGGSALASPGCYAPFNQTKPGDIVADHVSNVSGSPITDEAFTISLRTTASATQPATRYNTTLVYAITPIY